MTRSEFFKRTLTGILAAIGLSKIAKAETGVGLIHQIRNNPSTLSDMPYKNMGIFFSKGHSRKRINLEWVDGLKFNKVKAVEDENGKYVIWEPKQSKP